MNNLMNKNEDTPSINLDMNNISNLFFAVELSQTALRHVCNQDEIFITRDYIDVKTKAGTVRKYYAFNTVQVFTDGNIMFSQSSVMAYADNIQRLAKIMEDLKTYPFKAPEFHVVMGWC